MQTKEKALMCAIALSGLVSGLGQQAPATLQFSLPAYDVAEDAGKALITVIRSGDTRSFVAADYATSDGTAIAGKDYLAQSGTVPFASGQTHQTISLDILDDGLVERDDKS